MKETSIGSLSSVALYISLLQKKAPMAHFLSSCVSGLPLWPNDSLPPYTWLLPSNYPQSAWVRGGCCHSLLPRVQSQGLNPGSNGARSINWKYVSLGNYQLLWKDLSNNHSDPDFPHDINNTKLALVCMQCAEMHVGKGMLILTTKNLDLVLVVDVGSCPQQSLNCLSMSILGSYPQRNITILMREREIWRRRDKLSWAVFYPHSCEH